MTRDPHGQAYTTLFDRRSRRIAQNFWGQAEVAKHPERAPLCLSCHSTNGAQALRDPDFALDGVGCESCHGPAEHWRPLHYRNEWKQKSDAAKAVLGLAPLKDLRVRAETCVACHVGTGREQEVNHDLIAAGHPRLRFELTGYLAKLPKHWDETAERQAHPDFEARAWVLGQVASARAALRLLQESGVPPKEAPPWPEFAHYDCFACHHGLGEPSGRQERGYAGRMPGSLPVADWYWCMPQALLKVGPALNAPPPAKLQDRLKKLHEALSRPTPNRGEVDAQARQADFELGGWLTGLDDAPIDARTAPIDAKKLLRALLADPQPKGTSWDKAAQFYLAVTALHRALEDGAPSHDQTAWQKARQALLGQLAFPPGQDSPDDAQFFEAMRKKPLDKTRAELLELLPHPD
jgi:hypothetical protein